MTDSVWGDVVGADVSQQDSGNYTCEVRGPQSTLLGHVTHYLFVRGAADHQPVFAPVLTIIILSFTSS